MRPRAEVLAKSRRMTSVRYCHGFGRVQAFWILAWCMSPGSVLRVQSFDVQVGRLKTEEHTLFVVANEVFK